MEATGQQPPLAAAAATTVQAAADAAATADSGNGEASAARARPAAFSWHSIAPENLNFQGLVDAWRAEHAPKLREIIRESAAAAAAAAATEGGGEETGSGNPRQPPQFQLFARKRPILPMDAAPALQGENAPPAGPGAGEAHGDGDGGDAAAAAAARKSMFLRGCDAAVEQGSRKGSGADSAVDASAGATAVIVEAKTNAATEAVHEENYDFLTVLSPFVFRHVPATRLGVKTGKLTSVPARFDAAFGDGDGDGGEGGEGGDEAVYQAAVAPLVRHALGSGRATAIAFGQTGSGKTFTTVAMQRLALQEVFMEQQRRRDAAAAAATETTNGDGPAAATTDAGEGGGGGRNSPPRRLFDVAICVFESYRHELYDLLDESRARLQCREGADGAMHVVGAALRRVTTLPEALAVVDAAFAKRVTHTTSTNWHGSSRSHAFCKIILTAAADDDAEGDTARGSGEHDGGSMGCGGSSGGGGGGGGGGCGGGGGGGGGGSGGETVTENCAAAAVAEVTASSSSVPTSAAAPPPAAAVAAAGWMGSLTLVDLAGSERRKDAYFHAQARVEEMQDINWSLACLKSCLRAIRGSGAGGGRGDGGRRQQHQPHVKYRDSKLTLLLKEVFTDPSHWASFVACFSPTKLHWRHTEGTLTYCAEIRAVDAALQKRAATPAELEEALQVFYMEKKPGKAALSSVRALLDKYRGREQELHRALKRAYRSAPATLLFAASPRALAVRDPRRWNRARLRRFVLQVLAPAAAAPATVDAAAQNKRNKGGEAAADAVLGEGLGDVAIADAALREVLSDRLNVTGSQLFGMDAEAIVRRLGGSLKCAAFNDPTSWQFDASVAAGGSSNDNDVTAGGNGAAAATAAEEEEEQEEQEEEEEEAKDETGGAAAPVPDPQVAERAGRRLYWAFREAVKAYEQGGRR